MNVANHSRVVFVSTYNRYTDRQTKFLLIAFLASVSIPNHPLIVILEIYFMYRIDLSTDLL